MPRHSFDRLAILAVDAIVVVATTLALLLLSIGVIDIEWGWLRLRATHVWRALAVAGLGLSVGWWLLERARSRGDRGIAHFADYAARRGVIALLLAVSVIYWVYAVRACGGLDSYGYVGASALIASGALKEDQPLAALLPFERAAYATAPLGFVVGHDGSSRVPRFPLGLPLVMAAFRIVGPTGPLLVSQVLACATLLIVFLLARDVASTPTALFAAALVAVHPTFVNAAIQPMSDVPAAFWLVAGVWLALVKGSQPILAGLCLGMSLLTRPALLPAIVVTLALYGGRLHPSIYARGALSIVEGQVPRKRSPIALLFGTTAVFLVTQLLINASLYGSPTGSGYGTFGELFQSSRMLTNLANIARWVTYTSTPILWVAWALALVLLRREKWPTALSIVALGVTLPYVFYLTYDDWESTRFLLPAIVLVIIISARSIDAALSSMLRPEWRTVVMLILALAGAYGSRQVLEEHHVFDLWRGEAKYALVGQWFRDRTPPRSVVVSSLHSGAIRYYGGRDTIRWDELPPGSLIPTLQSLEQHGYSVYLALDEPSEAEPFRGRFQSELEVTAMDAVGRVREVNFYRLSVSAPRKVI